MEKYICAVKSSHTNIIYIYAYTQLLTTHSESLIGEEQFSLNPVQIFYFRSNIFGGYVMN